MYRIQWILIGIFLTTQSFGTDPSFEGPALYYWNEKWHGRTFINFGDYLSLKLVERIVERPLQVCKKVNNHFEKKLLAIGSILSFAREGDVIWGTGVNGKLLDKKNYPFKNLDVRAVRGPLTREFLINNFQIPCPEIYGDPALLLPYFFPEFKRKEKPSFDYIIIPHYSEEDIFPKEEWENVVFSTDPWDQVIEKILDSRLVISSSLHGIIVAEAYGIPACMLRVTENEPFLKYQDYYLGTNRPSFRYATSVEEAMEMGGEPAFDCDLKKLYEAFPFDCWPQR